MRSTGTLTRWSKKFCDPEFLRFLVVGCINTGAGYVIYLALIRFLEYRVAYSLAFALGILLSYFLNTRYVFRTALSLRKLLQFPLVYVVQYLLGISLLYVLVQWLRVPAALAPLAVVGPTVPVTFLVSRTILKQRRGGAG